MSPLVAGVDVSGRGVGRTALAWVEGDGGRPRLLEPPVDEGLRGRDGDGRLVELIVDRAPAVVALDAPLALPHAVTCTEPDCSFCFPPDGSTPSYGTRALEGAGWRELMPGAKSPMPMVMVAGIAFRAIYLRRRLEPNVACIVETWPMGVYRTIEKRAGTAHGSLDAKARTALLATVLDGAELIEVDSEERDQVDAAAAAYAAWCIATGCAKALRTPELADEGAIWLPDFEAISPS